MPAPNPIDDAPLAPLPFLLAEAKEAGFAELHRRLADRGFADVRAGHGCVFRFVGPEGMRLTRLSEAAEISKQACGEIVDQLEALGYVERVPDPEDRRAKVIRLTDLGVACQEAAVRIFGEIEAEWAERFGEQRIEILRALLEELYAAEREVALPA
jgi:DNA-binding MarR family transcriptional regulator